MRTDLDVAVVGAGIAGLSLAYRLRAAGRSVTVFEAAGHVGGRMASVRHDGYVVDAGAEQIATSGYERTWRLLHELGIDDVPRVGGPIGVWRDGRTHAGVADPRGLVTGAGLSVRGRLSLARFLARSGARRRSFGLDRPEATPLGLATVRDLAARHHPDCGRYLFEPVVSAFFGWDPARSAAAPFVGLLLGVGPASTWRTYADGMDTLARRLAEHVDVRLGTAVEWVAADGERARLRVGGDELTARTVVLCVPAPVARELYPTAPESERRFLAACEFTPMLKVSFLLDRPLAPRDGRRLYALLTPAVDEDVVAGIIFDHVKCPARVPAGRGLLTVMAAPRAIPALAGEPDEHVVRVIAEAVQRYVPDLAPATVASFVHRIRYGLPSATPAAMALRAEFARRPLGPVDYAGDWVLLRPNSETAIHAGALAAQRILHVMETV